MADDWAAVWVASDCESGGIESFDSSGVRGSGI